MRKICLLVLLIFFFAAAVNAEIRNSITGSLADVQATVNAAANGDTVVIPAGTFIWGSPGLSLNKGIILQGAGSVGNNQTIIVKNGVKAIHVNCIVGKPFRITGITFKGTNPDNGQDFDMSGICRNWRIDNCQFIAANPTAPGLNDFPGYVSGTGLIDHCILKSRVWAQGDNIMNRKRPFILGKSYAVYVEDNAFPFGSGDSMDCNESGSFVFRHNNVTDMGMETHPYHVYPSGVDEGCFSFEVYDSTFTKPGGNGFNVVGARGGTGVFYNIIATGYNFFGNYLFNDRSCTYTPLCDGSSSYDENTAGMQGYPCHGQVGFATESENSSGLPQERKPIYAWNNKLNGGSGLLETHDQCSRDKLHIVEGRDFYNNTVKPGYTPYHYPHPLSLGTDNTSPSDIAAVRDGTSADISSTNSTTQLSANWTVSNDAESPAIKYYFAIGTHPNWSDVVDWTDNGASTSVTKTGLSLTVGGKYYFTVFSENTIGLNSESPTTSNGVTVIAGGGQAPSAPMNLHVEVE